MMQKVGDLLAWVLVLAFLALWTALMVHFGEPRAVWFWCDMAKVC